jgi:hypothetical protein
MIYLCVFALLVFYAMTAHFEAQYFYYRDLVIKQLRLKNEHHVLVVMRMAVWGLFYLYTLNWALTFWMIALFPIIHDGLYYQRRHKLDPSIYNEGFWDYSKTDTALISLNLFWRVTTAVAGTLVFIFA